MSADGFSRKEALLVLDADLKVRAANRAFYEMFRLAPEESVGRRVYEIGGRAWDEKLRAMLEVVLKGSPQSDHFELIHDESQPGHGILWLSAKLLPSANPSDATILLSIEDLTTGRTTEESLAVATHELETFAELASRVAHELNNLLTVVRMNADLIRPMLAQPGLQTAEPQEVQDIVVATERAEELTRRLLVSSRRALPQPTGLDRVKPGIVAEHTGKVAGPDIGTSPAEQGVRPLKHGGPTGTETILLVEDEKALRRLQKRILSEAGYRVLEASDGAMALRVAAAEVGEIDLVLTDVEMPNLGGRGMVDELHELSPGMRVLFMSGYSDNEILRRGIRTSEMQFLQKPFTAEALRAAVRNALSRPATTSA